MALKTLVMGLLVAALPTGAFAQAAIAGTVKDSTGAAVAGVQVQTASTVLIEKARTTLTDRQGRYRVESLPSGTYTVTFTLAGWMPYELTGLELSGSLTATVDVELRLGAVVESVTVVGETPVVDTHTAKREMTLSNDALRSMPTVRTYNSLLALVPGVTTSANDTVTNTASVTFPVYGGRTSEGRLMMDGLTVGSPPTGNSATSYVIDAGLAQEVTFTRSGGLGESETAGLVINIVPRSGGNTTHGSLFASGTGARWQTNNLTPELQNQGLQASTPLTNVYDVSGSLGGALMRDRLWYFATVHSGGSTKQSPNVYYNLNAGNPSAWLYAPDVDRRAYSDRTFENGSARIMWQATPRNRLTAYWDRQSLCRDCTGATPGLAEPSTTSPEAVGVLGRPLTVTQATWMSPLTPQLLLEAGYSGIYFGVGNFERSPNPTRDLIRVVEQCANGCAANGNIPGLVYRSQDFSVAYSGSYVWSAAATWVTPTRTVKVGYQHTLMTDDRTWMTNDQNLTYRVNNGVPNQLTQSISPWVNNTRAGWDGLFAQTQWSKSRMTIQAAIRFDRASSWFPEQQEGPSRFAPTPIVIPATRGVDSFKDISPRFGMAYDVFGNGHTALKFTAGKYLEGVGTMTVYANTNPSLRLPQTTSTFGTAGVTRAWIDANDNFAPDCDLRNPAMQDLRSTGGDLCGVMSNTQFGQNVLTNSFDPAALRGWGVRPSDWNLSASLQQQIGPRSSIDVTYVRRWFRGFFAADNQALEATDLTPFSITAPADARLPGGGGYVISGLYDVVPEKAGQVDNLIADSRRYGNWSQQFDGVDVSVNVRIGSRFTFTGGTSTGQTVADNCDIRAGLPELSTAVTGTTAFGAGLNSSSVTPLSPYCHVAYGFLTQFRGLSSYRVPKAEFLISAIVQSKPGAQLSANYAVPNAAAAESLKRNLSGNAANATVNLIAPGTMYGDRLNQLDVRVARTFGPRRAQLQLALDVYNTLNSSAVLSYNSTFVPNGPWLQPLSILSPRMFRFTAELVF